MVQKLIFLHPFHLVYTCIKCYYAGDWNRLNTQIFKLSPGNTECTSLTADTSSLLRLDLKTKGLIHWNLSSLICLLSLLHFGILQKAHERKQNVNVNVCVRVKHLYVMLP